MSEDKLWKDLSIGMSRSWHANRVESHATSAGIPDVDYCIKGFESHIELKFGKTNDLPEIRGSQIRWMNKRTNHGGKPFLLTRLVDETGNCYEMIHKGSQMFDLDRSPVFEYWAIEAVAFWKNGIDFEELKQILSGENYGS